MTPLGPPVSQPTALRPSSAAVLEGRTVRLINLRPEHADHLFPLVGGNDATIASLWTYMLDGPWNDIEAFRSAVTAKSKLTDPCFFAIQDSSTGRVLGQLSLMNIVPEHLRVEIGSVLFSPALQRTTGATEAVYLLIQYAVEILGYRRVEWKCNALNQASQNAAVRLGFSFEGVFRQHMVLKGRSRDTAWYSILKEEWEQKNIKKALELWLREANFDAEGRQKKGLVEIRKELEDLTSSH
ncbi:hypothetical protein EYZ11_010219 [Aspergillus tanneri]|uniref:N-acetyltransferase domain-containing protein n=1 Tax=Aspergillus tanneri TaxID=1220188 RepID=A0A4S3J5X6_9EURO|nr:uncharacterized protein ATNIH1004_003760 [Aspergillus tanneri]KAA8651067.1 hypothetical protein ATNIH1004_003760 [Aspergillus tanneri]THC90320.1 hypothetical protein EYZ11_010219 [Aspergillus tanneri]